MGRLRFNEPFSTGRKLTLYSGLHYGGGVLLPADPNALIQWLTDYQADGVFTDVVAVPLDGMEVTDVPVLSFASSGTITVPDLVGTETVVSSNGTSTPTVAAGVINCTAGTIANIILSDGSNYPCSENPPRDTSGNGNNATSSTATLTTDDEIGFSHNLRYGHTPALVSAGTQWIDSSIPWTSDTIIRIGFNVTEIPDSGDKFFGGTTGGYKWIGYSNGTWYAGVGGSTTYGFTAVPAIGDHVDIIYDLVDMKASIETQGGLYETDILSFESSTNNINFMGSDVISQFLSGGYESIEVEQGGSVVLNLIALPNGQGMQDKLTGDIYTNAGLLDFTTVHYPALTHKTSAAVNYDGVADHCVLELKGMPTEGITDCTISYEVYIDDAAATRVIWSLGNSTNRLFFTGGTYRLNAGTDTGVSVVGDTWQTLSVTYDGYGNAISMSIDSSVVWAGLVATGDLDDDLYLGARYNTSVGVFFSGLAKNFSIEPTVVDSREFKYPDIFDWTPDHDLGITWDSLESRWVSSFDPEDHRINSSNVYPVPSSYATIADAINQINTDGVSDALITVAEGTYVDSWGITTTSASIEVIGQESVTLEVTSGDVADINTTYLYLENIVFDASSGNSGLYIHNEETTAKAYFKRCEFNNSSNKNGLRATFGGEMYLVDCVANGNDLDGFNYHELTNSPKVFELRCIGNNNGYTGESNNGSTTHEDGRIIRLGGEYVNNMRNIHDIQTAQSILLSCDINTSRGVDAPYTSFNVGFGAIASADVTLGWLFDCDIDGGVNTSLYLGKSGICYTDVAQDSQYVETGGAIYRTLKQSDVTMFADFESVTGKVTKEISEFSVNSSDYESFWGNRPYDEDGIIVDAKNYLPIAAPGSSLETCEHNGCSVGLRQTATEFTTEVSRWYDGSDFVKQFYADILAHPNGLHKSYQKSEAATEGTLGICLLKELGQYPIGTWMPTPAQYLRNLLYWTTCSTFADHLVPAEVTAGTGIGPNEDWADNGDGKVLLVEASSF